MNLKQNFFQEATSYEQLAKKPYKCWHCNKSYFLKHHLKRHTTFECGKLPQLQCPSCPRRFTYKSSLKRHKITHLPQVSIGAIKHLNKFDLIDLVLYLLNMKIFLNHSLLQSKVVIFCFKSLKNKSYIETFTLL